MLQEAKQLPVVKTLQELRAGGALAEVQEGIAQVVRAARATGKPGKVVLTLEIRPLSHKTRAVMVISDKVEVKPPLLPKDETVFFSNDAGELAANDQRQQDLNFTSTIDQETGEVMG